MPLTGTGRHGPLAKRSAFRTRLAHRARQVVLAATTLILLALAWGAMAGGWRQLAMAGTAGQRVETAVQLVAGALTILVVVTAFAWRQHAGIVRTAWAGALATAAALSALVWGPPMPLIALLFGGFALLFAWLVVRALRYGAGE